MVLVKKSGQILKYHMAPSLSINAPDCGGSLKLGSIIRSVSTADKPINIDCHVPVAAEKVQVSHHRGFTKTREQMRSSKYSVFARLVALKGIGGEMGRESERSDEDVYNFPIFETTYFVPSMEYIKESMNKPDVEAVVRMLHGGPVYMVTGLQIARNPSVRMSKVIKRTGKVEAGVQVPGGVLPAELGSLLNRSKEVREEMGFEDSSDFIWGIRVKKLTFERHWLRWRGRTTGIDEWGFDEVPTVFFGTPRSPWDRPQEVVDLGDDSDGEVEVEEEVVDGQVVVKTARGLRS